MNLIKRLWAEEEGQGMVEYVLILALISIVAIGIMTQLGGPIQDTWQSVLTAI